MSGHSKWANIRHRKDAADRKRGAVFTKMSRELMVAARLGGSDPASNNRLRIAIVKARASNMPRDNIERAIKKGAGEMDGQIFEDMLYEIYAPGGVAVMVSVVTDKKTRTTPEIKSIVTKYGASLAETNAVSRLFTYNGAIEIARSVIGEDELTELVLDSGADDLKVMDEYYLILTSPDAYTSVSDKLSEKNIETLESSIRWLPMEGTEVGVSDVEQAKKLLKFIETLEDHDDVQDVHHNMNIDDSIVDQLDG
jgi:YebC/PmpR family DNA-binding regulatory protein